MKLLRLALLPVLLFAAISCKKDKDDAAPSKSGMLTGVTWKDSSESLTLNGYTGTDVTDPTDVYTYKFMADGKLAITSSGQTTTGTWVLQNDDSQLLLTNPTLGSSAQTVEVFELTTNRLSFGYSFTQTQIQQSLASVPGSNPLIPLILLASGNFTFPANTPKFSASTLTSMQYKANLVPQ